MKGAAWSVPLLAVAAVAPSAAAQSPDGPTPCQQVTRTFNAGAVTNVVVPAGVTEVTYVVRGAGGGGGDRAGFGDLTTGTITLAGVAATTFEVVVGAGGNPAGQGTGTGGAGYGNGGNSTVRQHNLDVGDNQPGGGGGGTALLLGTTPLVVAGGGGGNYLSVVNVGETRVGRQLDSETFDGKLYQKGNATKNGSAAGLRADSNNNETTPALAVHPAIAASGATGGSAGGTGYYLVNNANWSNGSANAGTAGGAHGNGANGGGNGGNGGAQMRAGSDQQYRAGAGGGGGGYAGGGGGGLASARYTPATLRPISAGSGAGGSSYRISSQDASALGLAITGTAFAPAGIAPTNSKGHPGLVTLSWCEG